MATTRNVDLYLNLARPVDAVLLAGRGGLTAAEPPVFIAGEYPTLRFQFLNPSIVHGVAPSVEVLEAGDVIVFGLKKKAGGTLLVSATGFVLVGSGNERRYEAAVNFDTEALTNAFGDDAVISAVGEVRIQNAANTRRKPYQFRCTVRGRIYDGESAPVAAEPQYPAPESVLTNGADTAAIKRGSIDLDPADYEGVAVAFATEFSAAPTMVRAWVQKKAGAAAIQCFENHDTVTAAGFTVDLGAPVPADAAAGDYKLAWLAIL